MYEPRPSSRRGAVGNGAARGVLEELLSGEAETEESESSAVRRLAELGRAAPTALMLYGLDGALLAQNEAALQAFGAASLAALFGSPERASGLIADVLENGRLAGEAELCTRGGNAWFLTQARATRDPETGASAIAFSAEDLTVRRNAERAKDEFISIVNHELRTPLTAIRGAVGLLANDVVEDSAQKVELFEIAWENVLRLGRLVDDLLDVQRLRLGAVDLVLATLAVAPLVRETLELLTPTAEAAGVTLRLVEPTPEATVRVDPGRFVQALANLVSNAIKHSPPGTEVRVEIEERAPSVRVHVQDQGSGVPAAFVSKLFAPFSQADATDARSRGGAGLGLYIVRTLVEAHGGTVGYDSGVPCGSAFFFELPGAHTPSPPSIGRESVPRSSSRLR